MVPAQRRGGFYCGNPDCPENMYIHFSLDLWTDRSWRFSTKPKTTGRKRIPPAASGTQSQPVSGQEAGSVCRKVIQAQDVCPICQEELLEKKQPVSYCRFGCGNDVHISCMQVWADHQNVSDGEEMVKCPLCGEDFSTLKLLQEQRNSSRPLREGSQTVTSTFQMQSAVTSLRRRAATHSIHLLHER